MPDIVKEMSQWPVNGNGEIVVSAGSGGSTIVGYLPEGCIPIAADGGLALAYPSGSSVGVVSGYALSVPSQPIPTVATVFIWPTVVKDTLALYNSTTGVFQFPEAGTITFDIEYNLSASTTTEVYAYLQVSSNGTTWADAVNTGRQFSPTTTTSMRYFSLTSTVSSSLYVRVMLVATTANAVISDTTIPAAAGAKVLASTCTLSYSKG